MRYCCFVVALVGMLSLSAFGQTGPDGPLKPADAIHFPNLSPPTVPVVEISRLSGDQLYVIHGDTPFLLIPSPQGLVTITEEAGPVKIRGRFVDAPTKIETRSFSSKLVCVIEATGKGRVDLIVVPVGATSLDQVKRRTIDVDSGQSPPPIPSTSSKLVVVVIEETAEAAANRGVMFADKALAKRMKAKGHQWRIVDKDVVGPDNQPPADIKRLLDLAKGRSYPQLFLVDERGQIRTQTEMPKSASGLVDLLTKAGG